MAFRTQSSNLKLYSGNLKISRVYSSCIKPKNMQKKALDVPMASKDFSVLSKSGMVSPKLVIGRPQKETPLLNTCTSQHTSSAYMLTPDFKLPMKRNKPEPNTTKPNKSYLTKGG